MEEKEEIELNEAQKVFCQEYIFDWNGSRAYRIAYPSEKTDETIRANASRLLTKANVKAYIDDIQSDLEKTAGMSRLRVLREHEKIAFSNIAHLHETWVTRKEFDKLTDEQKACIMEIQTQTRMEVADDGTTAQVDFIKIKLYDKHKSLESIAKMLGYNEPDKMDLIQTIVVKFQDE